MPSPSLFAYNRIEDLWASVLSPWIRQQNARAWSDNRPTAFVLPNNTWVDAVKRLCLEKKTDTFAIQWWTQGQLRAHLLSHYLPQSQLALREDMQFLMSHAVQPNNAQPQEILPDPDPFLRLYDQIASAGWSAEAFEDPFWHGIANRFEDLLDKSHLLSTWQADKILAQRAGQKPQPPLASLLILGFGPYNGSSLLLLKTAVAMADHSTICLDISDEDNPFQHAFVGAWEQAYGECEFVLNPDYPPLPFQPLADNFANKQAPLSASSNPSPIYHIANDLSEEAEAIFHRALSFVAEGTCVGIVFVRANALYREVSLRLGKANLPHYDALGFWGQQSLPFRWFQSWVNLQNELCLSQLLPFLEYCRELSILPVEELATIQKCLKYTYETVWTDDLVVLMAYLKNAKTTSNSDQNTTQEETTLSFLEKWIIPSEPKTMREWVQSVLMLLQAANLDLEWDERQERLQASIEGLMSAEPSPLKKEKALAWMTQVLRKAGRMRTALGNHIQAPLVLMSPEDVATRSWSHLILAGLNDGNWPQPIDFSPALPEKRIQALNEQVLLRGDQGEGHLSLRTGYSLLLTNDATRRRHYDCFYRLLAAPTKGLALTASTTAEDDPNRHLAPSELLQSLYRCDRGQALDEATWSALARQTQKCLASIPKEPQEHLSLELNFPPIEATKKAYKARRDPSQPFGPFEFSFQAPPPDGIPLPCKAWEALLKRPASVWLENILKVAKPSTFTEAPQWALAIGTWVHQWLGSDNPKDGANELSWHSEVTRLSLQCLLKFRQLTKKVEGPYRTGGIRPGPRHAAVPIV